MYTIVDTTAPLIAHSEVYINDGTIAQMRLRATPRTLLLDSRIKPRPRAPVLPVQLSKTFFSPSKQAAQLRNTLSDVVQFDATKSQLSPEEVGLSGGSGGPPDERTIKLGKSAFFCITCVMRELYAILWTILTVS